MVFVHDREGRFPATLEEVWAFVGSGAPHSRAHRHKDPRRRRLPGNAGVYAWTQRFEGRPTRFAMRWRSYHPLGIAYDVLEGPFSGSQFFLYYRPEGARTSVGVVGDFVSPTLPARRLPAAVRDFFSVEFHQDLAAIRRSREPRGGSRGRP